MSNGVQDSPGTSRTCAMLAPPWAPPKAPLPPHRLAKIANALGVSTPVPAIHLSIPLASRTSSETSTTSDVFRRSPTPSQSPSNIPGYSPPSSKYLLHVIPPVHLPHETDEDFDLTPPPATASGYHTQFHRGTLVPLQVNFQSQLITIAKEYALPSTAGMILYLVSSANISQKGPPTDLEEPEEPGPRLSEDIWRHLWTRVIKSEQRDDSLLFPLMRHPSTNRSSPNLLATSSLTSQDSPLRPLLSTPDSHHPRPLTPIPPSPSTPSSSNAKSDPPSSSNSNTSDTDTPDTSTDQDSQARANSLDLPGLNSPSIIPILAKVEFDIDLRRAPWYDPWIRSRRMNYAKRAESRSNESNNDPFDDSQERHRRISLLTGRAKTSSPVSFILPAAGGGKPILSEEPGPELSSLPGIELASEVQLESAEYEQLPDEADGDQADSDSDSDEAFAHEITARVTSYNGRRDPLADVFGTDGDSWTEMHRSNSDGRRSKRQTNPNIVELSMSAAELAALPSPTQSEISFLDKDVDEIQALLDQTSPPSERSSSLTIKKHVPPPLILVPRRTSGRDTAQGHSPGLNTAGSGLAYLHGNAPENEDDNLSSGSEYAQTRVPSVRRGGAVYDDLDLGLDPSEDFDVNDPNDHRRSQYLMKAQLDEIERTMAQLSPRMLSAELVSEPSSGSSGFSLPLSPAASLSPSRYATFPPSPPAVQYIEPFHEQKSTVPAPTLALNGVPAPASPLPESSSASSPKKHAAGAEDRTLTGPPAESPSSYAEPVIPLSPDPFGRSPSDPSSSVAYWEKPPTTFDPSGEYPSIAEGSGRESQATSRFSTDSLQAPADSPGSLVNAFSAVTSIRKLWKKSGSRSSAAPTNPAPNSSRAPTPTQTLPPQEPHDGLPKTPTSGMFNLPLPRRSMDQRLPSSPRVGQQLGLPPSPILGPGQAPSLPQPGQGYNIPPSLQPGQAHNITPSLQHGSGPGLNVPSSPRPGHSLNLPPNQSQFSQQQHINMALPQQQPHFIPLDQALPGRSANPQPIRAAQMQPRGNSNLANLTFDQESPYPVHRAPSFPPRPLTPARQQHPTATISPPPPPLPTDRPNILKTPTPPPPSQSPPSPAPAPLALAHKPGSMRKSILKGFKGSISSTTSVLPPGSTPDPRGGMDKPNGGIGSGRPRRPSVTAFGSNGRGSISSPEIIPPSPQIPEKYLNESRQSQHKSKLSSISLSSGDWTKAPLATAPLMRPRKKSTAAESVESLRRPSVSSLNLSRDSGESGPSVDTSQFEMISPGMNVTSVVSVPIPRTG